MPKPSSGNSHLAESGLLRLVKWASDAGVTSKGNSQLLEVGLGERGVPIVDSPATGEALVSNCSMGADLIRLEAGKGFSPHTHPGDHLLVIVGGQGTITYDGKIYRTQAGQVYLVEGEVPHAVGAITDHVILAIRSPHRKIDSDERMNLVEYKAVQSELGKVHCLICDIESQGDVMLHEMGCTHCPCSVCNPTA
jgi:quercetin dioxygenase-like cupin family protein